jgi:hypothetical protein
VAVGARRLTVMTNAFLKRVVPLAVAALLIVGVGTAIAVATPVAAPRVSIGNCTTEGAYVSCSIQGDIAHPRTITVEVWASPRQQIQVGWGVYCDQGTTTGSKGGYFTITGGIARKATRGLPLAAGHGGVCTPIVEVNPAGTGRIWVELYGTN